jgi:hypothetical protein
MVAESTPSATAEVTSVGSAPRIRVVITSIPTRATTTAYTNSVVFTPFDMKPVVLVLLMSMASASMIYAGCVSDCKDDYDSAVESCKLIYDDPEDADDLEMCIQSAKSDYQSCIEECKN